MGRYFYAGAKDELRRRRLDDEDSMARGRSDAGRVSRAVRGRRPRRSSSTTTICWRPSPSRRSRPTGDRVAYSVTRNDKKDDEATSDIWSVPWSGGKSAQLTRTPGTSEWQPRYRTGRQVAVLSQRCGQGRRSTQLWRMRKSGGARQVTNIPGGISDFDLSPDGKRAVVIAEVGLRVGSTGESSAADRDRPLPLQVGRRGLPRRSHAANCSSSSWRPARHGS